MIVKAVNGLVKGASDGGIKCAIKHVIDKYGQNVAGGIEQGKCIMLGQIMLQLCLKKL